MSFRPSSHPSADVEPQAGQIHLKSRPCVPCDSSLLKHWPVSEYHITFGMLCRVAQLIEASFKLGLGSGMVLAVPIPREAAAEGEVVEAAIRIALEEADSKGIKGSEVKLDKIGVERLLGLSLDMMRMTY